MPNRILRDWTDSENIDNLSVHAERFFTRLIMKVDDFGRYTANVKLLKSTLFPLKTDVRETDISRWLAECEQSALITLYNIASKDYLQIENFKQVLRQKIEKYPSIEQMTSNCIANDKQMISNCVPETKRNEVETETKNKAPAAVVFPFLEKEFLDAWQKWKEYKRTEHRFNYKSSISEQAALNALKNFSGENFQKGVEIIEQSISKGWKGFFNLKEEIYGNGVTPKIATKSEQQHSNNSRLINKLKKVVTRTENDTSA